MFGDAEAGRTARSAAGPQRPARFAVDVARPIVQLQAHAARRSASWTARRWSSGCLSAIDDRYRPEMRRMERMLLLQIVDTAWKDHLLVMDRLRSSVGLVGYAQVDPKVEYKREGMKLFEQMWTRSATNRRA